MLLGLFAVGLPAPAVDSRMAELWLFGGGVDGARDMLSAIAGSLITVTGVVFSVTIVALQLASSQFTPRVLRSFVADRTNQVVLGIFIGTFTYSLLVLRTIRSEADDRSIFVPQVAVLLAVALLLISIGALIVFVNHAARSIQASVILQRETTQTLARIAELFPEELAEPGWHAVEAPRLPDGRGMHVVAREAGYLQMVYAEALEQIASGKRLTIRMDARVGSFVIPGHPVATVWPARSVDDDTSELIAGAFLLGPERTPEQDAEYGIVEISDIAIRALSPGINDPTTAILCIDRLIQILAALANRRPAPPTRDSADGAFRFIALHTTFARASGLAFDQIRHYGETSPTILKKLLDAIAILLPLIPGGDRQVLLAHVDAIEASAAIGISHPADQDLIRGLVAEIRASEAEGSSS